MYPSIFGGFLVFVSTITAISLWVSFSIDLIEAGCFACYTVRICVKYFYVLVLVIPRK